MKKMAHHVALGTVISVIPAFTRIIVENRKGSEIWLDNSPNTEAWAGAVRDIHSETSFDMKKWLMTSVKEIRPQGDKLLIIISTDWDLY